LKGIGAIVLYVVETNTGGSINVYVHESYANKLDMERLLELFLSKKETHCVMMISWQYFVFHRKMRGPLLWPLVGTLLSIFINMNDICE